EAVHLLDQAGARVIAFDLLFVEPEKPVPDAVRRVAREAAGALAGASDPNLHDSLAGIAADDPDAEFAAALRASGKVLLPFALSLFTGAEAAAPQLADQVYAKLNPSPVEPIFPLQPKAALAPIPRLAAAAAGLGHVSIAFDRDGQPRYDYLALPFAGDFVPSMPVRIAAAYRAVTWDEVGLALGGAVA